MTPLISYIAPSAPATRCPATGGEAFLRPEIGFTPAWYRCALGIDFGERWHNDVDYRRETVVAMRAELRRRFPGSAVGGIGRPDVPLDLLTGVYGGKAVPALFGLPIVYAADNWPDVQHRYLRPDQMTSIEAPDPDTNPFFQRLLAQVDRIIEIEGRCEGLRPGHCRHRSRRPRPTRAVRHRDLPRTERPPGGASMNPEQRGAGHRRPGGHRTGRHRAAGPARRLHRRWGEEAGGTRRHADRRGQPDGLDARRIGGNRRPGAALHPGGSGRQHPATSFLA